MRTVIIAALVLAAAAGVATAHNECHERTCEGHPRLGRCIEQTGRWINICAPGNTDIDAWNGNDKGCWSVRLDRIESIFPNGTETGDYVQGGYPNVYGEDSLGGILNNCSDAPASSCVKEGRNNYTAWYYSSSFTASLGSCYLEAQIAITIPRQATTLSYDTDHSKDMDVARGSVGVSFTVKADSWYYMNYCDRTLKYRFNFAISNHGKNPRTPTINPDAARPTADGITFLEVASNRTNSDRFARNWIDAPVSYTEKYVRNDDTWKMEKHGYLSLTMDSYTSNVEIGAMMQ